MRRGLSLGVMCIALAVSSAHAQVPPAETPPAEQTDPPSTSRDILDAAESAMQQLQFRQTIKLLEPLVKKGPSAFDRPEDLHQAYVLLAAAHWYLDEFDAARLLWQRLLIKRPAFELDKLVYPKPMRDGFEKLRQQLIQEEMIKDVPKVDPNAEKPPTILRITEYRQVNSRAMTFMPFGLAQFEQGADGWGAFFATSQTVAALTHIASGVTMWTLSYQGKLDDSNYDALLGTVVGSLATWTVLTVWGIIDANVRHEPERVVRIERTIQTQEAADLRPPQPGRSKPAPTAGGAR